MWTYYGIRNQGDNYFLIQAGMELRMKTNSLQLSNEKHNAAKRLHQ